MKRIVYALLVAAAFLVPTQPLELEKLKPVETVRITKEGMQILVETDTGDMGRGTTVSLALWDLRETAAGQVYLDTAEFVLLSEGAEEQFESMLPYLKKSVRVCIWEGEMKLKEATEYLNVHKPKVYKEGGSLQTLISENGVLRLKEKNRERRENSA